MTKTKIEWTHRPGTIGVSWNPVTGCTPISEGCAHCYAERMSKRLAGRFGYPEDDPFRVTWHEDRLDQPLKWRKPRTVFVCSMGDLFHSLVEFGEIARIFHVMTRAMHHTFLVLTKRPDRMRLFLNWWRYTIGAELEPPHANIWLGVTAENQQRADERIPLLLQCPAAVRFVSLEPMLGPIDLGHVGGVDWVICGGESGRGARPMHPDWARSVRDQCAVAGMPFFFKQWGSWLPTSQGGCTTPAHLDGREHHEWPA